MSSTVTRWRTEAYQRLHAKIAAVVGDKTAKAFDKLDIRTVGDLLQHVPRRYMAGTELSDLADLQPGEEVAVLAEVARTQAHAMQGGQRGRGARGRLEAWITNGRHGRLNLTFFGQPKLIDYWEKQLHQGTRGIFAGKVGVFHDQLQLSHPDFVMLDEHGRVVGGSKANEAMAEVSRADLIGIYPATAKLRTWNIAESANLALEFFEGADDPLPASVRDRAGVLELTEAYRAVHQPRTKPEAARGLERLKFDEAFAIGLAMARRKALARSHGSVPRPRRADGLLDAFDGSLPFSLTLGQRQVSDQIFADLAQPHPMQRLLQGEVGSGKTVVAMRAMLGVIDAGGQAAFLAPTEVLATQHYQTITKMLGELATAGTLDAPEHATQVVLITGSMPAARKREALLAAASGEAGIVIGTHALLSDQVQFAELGLVVVDEQHRFGVEQRAALGAKATSQPHLLVMTATPIPRTVAMTSFGDLETSVLREIPAGRSEVSTVVVDTIAAPAWVDRAWQRIVEEVKQGRQAYVVCTRISISDVLGYDGLEVVPDDQEEAPKTPAIAVEELYGDLTQDGGPLSSIRVEMLHGRLPAEQKDDVMRRYAAGEIDVLISTTVIEVGVDVPNASMMVICDADRFGISQLHQLRGRIGRGEHPGVCLLFSSSDPMSQAAERLSEVAATRDGFRLAEADLRLRREGDVLGADQSGRRSSLRLLRVLRDQELIASAREIADGCIADDPEIEDPGLADIVDKIESPEWLERA
ncbi:ATP-dependent DNA helicase RecG [Microlunatus soli]|uniref:Probable DNA 3'-5' helicase RecG n=1 Tax=Microlunatus soli TaxID=630515 RepID=A0A1H1NNM8_9ACTN|nr:ATP-dependent DNA helicase RecG [Microlunatus soli]SDS00460.1 ATP-dependent DNA helicase RecG [Microlunatus soli]